VLKVAPDFFKKRQFFHLTSSGSSKDRAPRDEKLETNIKGTHQEG